ncbi:MAG: SDR family oxidoreductase [Anaerolineae bacterium]
MTEKKVAIVTAASRGIGAACARELAERGYALVMMARSNAVMDVAGELKAAGVIGSVTELADLQAVVQTALDTYGRIDAVVNSTGHPASGPLLDISDQDWHAGLDLLLLNVVRMARLVTPVMEGQGGGAIVNISTFAAFEPSLAFPVSSALRAALGSFTRLYADAYAGAGIRMNNVLPGFMDSYQVDESTRATIPMGRAGSVAELARTVAFLLSAEAGYITGQNLRVDGGLTRSV